MSKKKALFGVFLSTSLLFGCSQNTENESQSKNKELNRKQPLRPFRWKV